MFLAEPNEKINTPSVSDAGHPQDIAPTHFCYCSYWLVGREIEAPADQVWLEALLAALTHNFIPVRSPDRKTIYIVPALTEVVWRGEC